MVRKALKVLQLITHFVGGVALIVGGLLALSWGDTTPPSYIIAMWTIPHELVPGQRFTTTEIFFRRELCARHIDHGFSQDDDTASFPSFGNHQVQSPTDLWFPTQHGLLRQNFNSDVPIELHKGPAIYVTRFLWFCWWNPATWVHPFEDRETYPVWILGPEDIGLDRFSELQKGPRYAFERRKIRLSHTRLLALSAEHETARRASLRLFVP
jgi:hypothetical protein